MVAAGTDSAQQQELVAVCNILSAILSVEHRAVQPHLADIWQLLWLAARGWNQHLTTNSSVSLCMCVHDLLFVQQL